MKVHQSKYLTALLDGQLGALRRWRVNRHVRACPVCAAEYRRQQHVRRMLAEAPPAAQPMSDSPEFFWSKVRSEIERRGDETVSVPERRLTLADWLGQHQPALAAVTVVVVAAVAGLWMLAGRGPAPESPTAAPPQFAEVRQVSTSLPDTVATQFQSEAAGVTVIWVSGLPWTPDMTEMKTLFAKLDT